MTDRFEGLDEYLVERWPRLLAQATLLVGNRPAAEDLLQASLERLMRHWRRVGDDPEGYLRRTMYHLAVDGWRARRRRPEVFATFEVPQDDITEIHALRQALLQALAQLPPQQRALLVLRCWEGLSESETAQVLGCSVGAVKSGTSRGLDRLRAITATTWAEDTAPDPASPLVPAKGALR